MPRPPIHKPSYLPAALASAAIFALYVLTLGPSTAMWDTSEYITVAYTLGVPHPPGNPLFVILGRVFSILPIAPNVAMRINLLAAISSAVTAGIWFLLTERVLAGWLTERWQRLTGAAFGALLGATTFTVWSQSVVNEKVYTVSLLGLALVSWLVLRWCDDPDRPGAHKLLVLAAYLMGLGYANHMAGILALPATGIAVMVTRPKTILRWKLMLACAGALLLGATPFATQPIRAAHFPAINEGEVTSCTTKLSASCTFTDQTWERFKYNFNREQYGKLPLSERQAPLSAQIGMWWLYFKWQWLRDPTDANNGPQGALAAIFFALGLLGAWVHFKRDRTSFAYFGPLMFTLTAVLIYYLNFKYGAAQQPEAFCRGTDPSPCEVRDRDYFYLWSYSAWGVWAALGLMYLWESVASLLGAESAKNLRPRRIGWALASPVVALAFVPLIANYNSASRRGDTDTADWARDLLNSVEPYGILVTAGDNDMFPLWYAQQVEGIRKDVVIANTSLLNTDWFVRQMIRAPQFDYDPDTGPNYFRGKQWKKPASPVLKMTFAEADQIPDFTPLQQPMQFIAGDVKAEITPRMLTRADYLIYKIIQDNPDRPLHFARSTGNYAQYMGFGDYVATYGLTRKLSRHVLAATDSMTRLGWDGWIDTDATAALWKEFKAPASIARKNKWIDKPSDNIPLMYINAAFALTDSMIQRGDSTTANQVLEGARGIARALGHPEAVPALVTTPPVLGDTSVGPRPLPRGR